MNWFKLVGATEDPIPEDWEHDDPEIFAQIRFPWNKAPTQVCLSDRVILYAVGSAVLIATQRVVGEPGINPRRGPKGSADDRWPHTIEVDTSYYCSPLSRAPKLRTVAAEFAERYARRFRQGSHWRITEDEYEQLAAAVEGAGRPYRRRSAARGV